MLRGEVHAISAKDGVKENLSRFALGQGFRRRMKLLGGLHVRFSVQMPVSVKMRYTNRAVHVSNRENTPKFQIL